jgi:hypothetical protein
VERRGPDAYRQRLRPGRQRRSAPGSWVYFTLPTSGCGDVRRPPAHPRRWWCLRPSGSSTSRASPRSRPRRRHAAALRQGAPPESAARTVRRGRSSGTAWHRRRHRPMSSRSTTSSVFSPGVSTASPPAPRLTTRLVARVDLGARQGSAGGERAEGDAGRLRRRSRAGGPRMAPLRLEVGAPRRRWARPTGVLAARSSTGVSRLTQVEEANPDLDCTGACLPSRRAWRRASSTRPGVTYTRASTARKRDGRGGSTRRRWVTGRSLRADGRELSYFSRRGQRGGLVGGLGRGREQGGLHRRVRAPPW